MPAGPSPGCAECKEGNIERTAVYKVGALSWDMMGEPCEVGRNSRCRKKSQADSGRALPRLDPPDGGSNQRGALSPAHLPSGASVREKDTFTAKDDSG